MIEVEVTEDALLDSGAQHGDSIVPHVPTVLPRVSTAASVLTMLLTLFPTLCVSSP